MELGVGCEFGQHHCCCCSFHCYVGSLKEMMGSSCSLVLTLLNSPLMGDFFSTPHPQRERERKENRKTFGVSLVGGERSDDE